MRVVLGIVALALTGCGGEAAPTKDSVQEPEKVAAEPYISVLPTVLNDRQVRFVVETNLPTPVEVMAGLSLSGQAPDDVWIGTSERLVLDGPKTEFVLEGLDAKGEVLPAGDYDAEVSFYQKWGAENGNSDAAEFPDTAGVAQLRIGGSGVPASQVAARNEMQRWVMSNIPMNAPWDKTGYESRLGKSVKGPSTMSRLHDSYYFQDADVTLIVNRVRDEVTVWRLGDVTQ